MSKSVKIEYLDKNDIDKEKIENNALRCINNSLLGEYNNTSRMFQKGEIIYLNPTEQLCIKDAVKGADSVATVLSSGDFAIESVYHGVKDILTFDINKAQYYIASLKLAALQNMDYKSYNSFLSDVHNIRDFLSTDMYSELKKNSDCSSDVYYFMDVFLNKYNEAVDYIYNFLCSKKLINDRALIKPSDYTRDEYMKFMSKKLASCLELGFKFPLSYVQMDALLSMLVFGYSSQSIFQYIHGYIGQSYDNTYMHDEDSFNEAKNALSGVKISFINTDLSQLKNNLDRISYTSNSNFNGFKVIYLSNIPEYIKSNEFVSTVDNQLVPLLQDDGVILYCCQGISSNRLNISQAELDYIRSHDNYNDYSFVTQRNNIESYSMLSKKYNVDTVETEAFAGDGVEKKDTFVYVRKK